MSTLTKKRMPPNRERIIDEALQLAQETGWSKVTVRAIAERLKYAPPVLYQHFENKDHLTMALLEKGFSELYAMLDAAEQSSENASEKLLAIGLGRFAFAHEKRALHSLMYSTNSPHWFKLKVADGMCQTRETIIKLLSEITGDSERSKELFTNFIAIVKGYTFFATELPTESACQRFFPNTEPKEALKRALNLFLQSIEAK